MRHVCRNNLKTRLTTLEVYMEKRSHLRVALLGGIAGGLAEVIWVLAYAGLADADAAQVARAVATTFVPATWGAAWLVAAGIAIHFILALVLAAGFVYAIAAHVTPVTAMFAAVAVLAAVWGINFGVVLPIVNPGFVSLLPIAATLTSKLSFGIALAFTIHRFA